MARSDMDPAECEEEEQKVEEEEEEEKDDDDDCMVQMMPEWTIDQLGLYHMAELRKLKESLYDTPLMDPQPTSLLTVPAPMDLTLEEADMQIERCSVCQARLHFPGMRWKGIGVMDERIVPLEWVACSVQCRGRVESEERGQGFMKPRSARQQRSHSQSRSRSQSQASTNSSGSFGAGVDLGASGRFTTTTSTGGGSGAVSPSSGSALGIISTRGTMAMRGESSTGSIAVLTVPREDNNNTQGHYRQGVLYGLIKGRDLRNRARTLSL